MPTINKIRIVNYAYNDDKRLIIDETFEFHGKNGLMHLLNGGGKTVLIQAIIQPFIPLAKLGKREFEELFRKDKNPSYILVEWKLDNNNGYMTNGIAIKRISNSQDDEDNDKLDYFTFILESGKSKVNINNLKLSNKVNDKVTFMNYAELKTLINKSGASTYEKNSEAYKKALNSFRIDTKEWRNVIAKINSEEGGLLKLFENCNTSMDLMRDWILKSIKENLSESTNIPDLLGQTEKHIVKSRQKIEDKEKRRDFLLYTEDLNEVKAEVYKLDNVNEKTNSAKTELSNLSYSLSQYIKEKESEIEEIENQKEIINNRLDEIKIEELSSQYYLASDDKAELEEEKYIIDTKLQKLRKDLTNCDRLIRSLKVADLTKQRLDNEKELEDIKTKLAKLSQEQSEIDLQIQDLGFTIRNLYEEKIISLDNTIKSNKGTIDANNKELNGLRSRQNIVFNEHVKLEKNISSINAMIDSISKRIKSLVDDIDTLNIFLGVDQSEVTKEKDTIKSKISLISSEVNSLSTKKDNIKEQVRNNVTSIGKYIQEISAIKNQINSSENDIQKYRKELSDITTKLSLYDIDKFSPSQKENVKRILDDKIYYLSNSIETNSASVVRNKEILEKLSSGGIKINKDFIKYLDDKGIVYILGTDYIKNTIPSEEMRKEIISTNPLLPFAIILDTNSIEYIQKDMPEMYIDSPIIVLERETLNEVSVSNINGYAVLIKSIGILALYNKDLVIKKDVEQEKNKIKTEIARLKEEAKNWDRQKHDLILIKGQIDKFDYDEDYENSTDKLINKLKEDVSSKEDLSNDIKKHNEALDKELEDIENEIKDKEKSIRNLDTQISKCEELKGLLSDKERLNAELTDSNNQLKVTKKENAELTERTEALAQKDTEIKVVNSKLGEKVNNIKSVQRNYLHYTTGELIDGQLVILEQRYESLKSSVDSNLLGEYRKKESSLNDKIKEIGEKISKFRDYDVIEYDFNLEIETENRKTDVNNDINSYSSKVAVIGNKIGSKDNTMNGILEKLKPNALKERSSIGSNLEEEKKILSDKLEKSNSTIKNITSVIDGCDKVFNRVKDSGLLLGFKSMLPNIYNEHYIAEKIKVFEENNSELLNLRKEEERIKTTVKNKIETFLIEHSQKNGTIDNSMNYLKQMIANNNVSVDLYEIIERQVNIIDRLLDKIQTDLKVLENEEKYITERYLDVTRQYTEEINKIDKNSYITVKGKRLKMMKINNIKDDESSSVNLTAYVKGQLENLTNNVQIVDSDLVKAINREFNVENLLINYCKLNHVTIDFLKIEDNILLSKDRSWEEVTIGNSGGEKFVSYFVLFSTLINYERKNHLNKETVSMCLIMDNPFAAISSKHLLIPLFEYAKKTNIQLICLTDHNKVDIIDRFSVIHKLVIKTLINNKEFISSEKVKDDVEVMNDGFYYYNEQISLL